MGLLYTNLKEIFTDVDGFYDLSTSTVALEFVQSVVLGEQGFWVVDDIVVVSHKLFLEKGKFRGLDGLDHELHVCCVEKEGPGLT